MTVTDERIVRFFMLIPEAIAIAKQFENMATVRKMKEIVPEYKSNNSEYEVLDNPN